MTPLLFAIPMKSPAGAKTRLSTVMDDETRSDFALAMFERTLDVISRAKCKKTVLVVTESPLVASVAKGHGVNVLLEKEARGLNAAASHAASWAVENGFDRMAILPVDLPLLTSGEVAHLSSLPFADQQVLLCESIDGGTNCLMVSPPDAMAFRYGEGSFVEHQREARWKGLTCIALEGSNLRFDLDTSGHLKQFSAFWDETRQRRQHR